jgi:hypothetical protein
VRYGIGLFSYCVEAMPTYDVYVATKSRRLQYPRGLNIPSLGVAHSIALTMARVFIGRRSPRGHLSVAERDFHVEVVNEDGRTVLTVPGRWMGPVPDRAR